MYSTYYMSQSVIMAKYFTEQANLFSRARGRVKIKPECNNL